ncbi:AraC family transcriptional regulator [Paenibacillus hodogayensis]|uniref:AraC family transcriptional regulator n=1 Tax=Paenibacillus hodogayensis TaxID=279208 RepID=A0ABV5VPP1_9BACL
MELQETMSFSIRARIGNLMFDIHLDTSFLSADAPAMRNRHNHAMTELHFVASGSGRLALNGLEVPLVPHHAYLIPPGLYHAILTDKRTPLRKYTFRFEYIELQDDFDCPPGEIEALKAVFPPTDYRCIPNQSGFLERLQQIARELEERRLGYYTKVQNAFNEILIDLIRAMTTRTDRFDPLPTRGTDDVRSHLIDAYFDHYSSHLTLEHLAAQLHLSTRQTNRVLQHMYKKTFSEKLADIRIEAAQERLVNTDLPISLIAEQLGFASPSFFTKTFKKRTGITPHTYRKTNKKSLGLTKKGG